MSKAERVVINGGLILVVMFFMAAYPVVRNLFMVGIVIYLLRNQLLKVCRQIWRRLKGEATL